MCAAVLPNLLPTLWEVGGGVDEEKQSTSLPWKMVAGARVTLQMRTGGLGVGEQVCLDVHGLELAMRGLRV